MSAAYTVGSPPRSFPLCPYCYNHPRAEWGQEEEEQEEAGAAAEQAPAAAAGDGSGGTGGRSHGRRLVLDCPLPDAHPGIAEITVAEDDESGGGSS